MDFEHVKNEKLTEKFHFFDPNKLKTSVSKLVSVMFISEEVFFSRMKLCFGEGECYIDLREPF